MFTMYILLMILMFSSWLFLTSFCDSGSQGSTFAEAGKCDIRINIQTELQFLRNQLIQESSLRMQLDKELSDINRRLRQMYSEFDDIKSENAQLKERMATQAKNTEEKVREFGTLLNATKIDIKGLNNSMTYTIDQAKIRMTELCRNLNNVRVELVHNCSILGSQFKDPELCDNNQTMPKKTIEEILNSTTHKIEDFNATMAYVNTTATLLNTTDDEIHVLPVTGIECDDLLNQNSTLQSGVYRIRPHSDPHQSFDVFCDMETDGGGWIVFQRRMDGSEDFQRNYSDYQIGFGNLSREFWLGNDALHTITQDGQYQMRVDFETFSGDKLYAKYTNFSVGDEQSGYQLNISGFSGNAGDALWYSDGAKFSTAEKEQHISSLNCGELYGPMWHYQCMSTTPNGIYMHTGDYDAQPRNWGITWFEYKNSWEISMKKFAMKIKRA